MATGTAFLLFLASAQAGAAEVGAPVLAEDEATIACREIHAEALRRLGAHDYAGLDAMAREFRASKETFARGDTRLAFFYIELGDTPKGASEADCAARVQLLRDWFEGDPESVTPRIALARGLFSYAWEARGSGWAKTVTEEGWRLMRERLTEAGRILNAAASLPEKCPGWYSTRLKIAIDDDTPREEYERIFEEGIRAFPYYHLLYFIKANYLMPRWNGNVGEWEKFAAASADRIAGEEGDLLYARIVWAMHDWRYYGNPISETAVEWPRVRRGFEAICRRFSTSLSAKSEYCAISRFAPSGARELMPACFPRSRTGSISASGGGWKNTNTIANGRSRTNSSLRRSDMPEYGHTLQSVTMVVIPIRAKTERDLSSKSVIS